MVRHGPSFPVAPPSAEDSIAEERLLHGATIHALSQAELKQYPALLRIQLVGSNQAKRVVIDLNISTYVAAHNPGAAHYNHPSPIRFPKGTACLGRDVAVAHPRHYDPPRPQGDTGVHQVSRHIGVRVQNVHSRQPFQANYRELGLDGMRARWAPEIAYATVACRTQETRAG